MKATRIRTVLLAFVAIVLPASARTNYVDVSSGDDAHADLGSELAFATLRQAADSDASEADRIPATKRPGIVRFALCQTPSDDLPAKGGGVDGVLDWTRESLPGDEDVIVFPEFAFSSFAEEAEAWRSAALVWERAAAFARERRAFVVVNHPSRSEGEQPRIYDETRVFSPTGTVAAVYRKRNLAAMDRAAGLSPGDAPVMAELPFARLGLLVCKDSFFPGDKIRIEDYSSADVLVVQFSHPGVDDRNAPKAENFGSVEKERERLRSTRMEWADLHKPYLAVNRTGLDGVYRLTGGSFASDASGQIVSGLDDSPGVLVVDLRILLSGRLKPVPPIAPSHPPASGRFPLP